MAELTVPLLNFSPLGDLGKTIRDAMDSRAAGQTLSSIYSGAAAPVTQPTLLSQLGQSLGITSGQPQPQSAPASMSPAAPVTAPGATGGNLSSYVNAVKMAESSGNPNATNPNSSAQGLFQFTDGTWRDVAARHPELGLTPNGRSDPVQQQRAMQAFTSDNASALGKIGIEPTPGNLYAAHFLGAGGASNVLRQPDNTPMIVASGPQAVQANPFLAGMTVGDFKQWAAGKAGGSAVAAPQFGAAQSAQPQPITREQFQALAANPQTRPLAMAILQSRMTGNQYSFMNVNGRIVATNPKTGQVQDVTPQGFQVGSRSMTAEEKAQYGLSPDQPAQIDATGKVTLLNEPQEKNGGLMNVAAGGTVFDPKTRKPVFQNEAEATLDPATLNMMADQYLAGDKSVLQNLGRGRQGAANIVALRSTIKQRADAQGLDGNAIAQRMIDYVGDTSRERTAATQEGRMAPASYEAQGAIDLGRAASNAVPRTQWVPVNKAIQAYQKNTSDPALRAFGAANTTIINTYARAINPNGVGTVADKEHAREMLSTADGPEAYNAVLDQLSREIEIAHQSPATARNAFKKERSGRLSAQPAQPAIQEGATATNPQTGQRIIYRGGQWQAVQ